MLALGLWIGAIVFFILVAKVAFTVVPPNFTDQARGIHAAGQVVAGSLTNLHYLGIVLGILFLLFGLVLRSRVHWHSLLPQMLLVFVMLALTVYSQFSIIPRMDTARASAGGEITAVPQDNPARVIFDQLHRQSTHLEAIVLICGLVAFLLAGREPVAVVPVAVR